MQAMVTHSACELKLIQALTEEKKKNFQRKNKERKGDFLPRFFFPKAKKSFLKEFFFSRGDFYGEENFMQGGVKIGFPEKRNVLTTFLPF